MWWALLSGAYFFIAGNVTENKFHNTGDSFRSFLSGIFWPLVAIAFVIDPEN